MRWPLYIQSDITLINILFGIILQIFFTLNKKITTDFTLN